MSRTRSPLLREPAVPDHPDYFPARQPEYGYAPPAGYPGYAPTSQTNGMAVASLVAGIVGWSVFPLIASIAAVVLGHIARAQIRRTGEQGGGLALAGLILGYTGTVVAGAAMVLIIMFLVVTYRATVVH